jgi:shikimate dehydrogenase
MKMMDHIDPLAKRMGAINCIVVQEDGALHGFNNDGYGYIQCVKDAKPDWRADEGPIVVLGAGGARRAIVLSLVDEGAKEIRLVNRTKAKAEELRVGVESVVKVFDWSERNEAMRGAAMLVNTTNQGMYGQPALDVSLDALPTSALVSDAIYIPLETPLLETARLRGTYREWFRHVVESSVAAFKAWFGVLPEITEDLRKLCWRLSEYGNSFCKKIDSHCHVLDPARFPYHPDVSYRPAGQEMGTLDFKELMDCYAVHHALLVGPNSGYATDNACSLRCHSA